jgi:putative copper export protein
MTSWHAIRYLHLLAMAFFVGGQLVLVAAVVPTVGRGRDPDAMRGIARRFGWGSVVALAVLVATGVAMASHYGLWDDSTLHLKLALVLLVGALVIWHIRAPQRRALDGAIFVGSLAIVWLGVALAH